MAPLRFKINSTKVEETTRAQKYWAGLRTEGEVATGP